MTCTHDFFVHESHLLKWIGTDWLRSLVYTASLLRLMPDLLLHVASKPDCRPLAPERAGLMGGRWGCGCDGGGLRPLLGQCIGCVEKRC